MRDLPASIATQRLILRAPRSADARRIFDSYTQDPEVTRFLTWRPHSRLAEAEAYISLGRKAWEVTPGRLYLLALVGAEAEPIGALGLRRDGCKVELGYVLARDWWGHGLMPEAVHAVTEASLALDSVFRVQAYCDVDNAASARVLEKVGFIREARLERYASHPNVSVEPRACFMYAKWR